MSKTPEINSAVIIPEGNGRQCVYGNSFGPDRLIYWRGPNGTTADECTKGNAIEYIGEDGSVFGQGPNALFFSLVMGTLGPAI